jgi:hypothetical protein
MGTSPISPIAVTRPRISLRKMRNVPIFALTPDRTDPTVKQPCGWNPEEQLMRRHALARGAPAGLVVAALALAGYATAGPAVPSRDVAE